MAISEKKPMHRIAVVLVAFAAAWVTWPTHQGDFLNGDDQRFIIEHGLVNRPSWDHAATLLTVVHQDLYQPIPMLSFMANYALAEPTPAAQFPVSARNFKFTNIALHVLNAALVYWLIFCVADCALVAFITATLFAIHPYVIEPVAWICGRMILLGTLFSLIALIAALRVHDPRAARWAWAGGGAWLLALFSKIIPTVPVAGAWFARRRFGSLTRREWSFHAGLLLMSAVMVGVSLVTTDKLGMIELAEKELSTPAPVRLLLASRYYFENFLWPSRIAAWSPPPENVGYISDAVFIALLEWAALGTLIWIAAKRSPLAFTGLIAFVILMAPFLAATFARRFLTADRYMYLPMVGLHLAIAAVVVQCLNRLRSSLGVGGSVACAATPLCALAVIWVMADHRLAPTWRSTVTRDLHMVAINPGYVDAHAELAKAYIFENRADEALEVIENARLRWPDSPRLALQAGIAYRFKRDWPAAQRELHFAARQMPDNARVQYYYGRTLEMVGKDAEALACYDAVLREYPDYVPVLMALGDFHYFKTGNLQAAQECLERAVAESPFQRDAIYQLVMIAVRLGDWPTAIQRCEQILNLNPHDRQALLNMGVALANLGRTDEAIAIYRQLVDLEPGARAPRLNLALLFNSLGRFVSAEPLLRGILKDDPNDRDARIGLHDALAAQGQADALIALWQDAPAATFSGEEKNAWLAWACAIKRDRAAYMSHRDALPPDSIHRQFANWALVWLELSSESGADLREILGPPTVERAISATQRQYAASARLQLTALPENIGNSPAGLYALTRYLLYEGNPAARTAAETLAARPDAGPYAAAAAEIIAILSTPD